MPSFADIAVLMIAAGLVGTGCPRTNCEGPCDAGPDSMIPDGVIPDGAVDVASDTADATTDATTDGTPRDVVEDVGPDPCPARDCRPHNVWPPSGSTIATRSPRFSWTLPSGATVDSRVEVCTDPMCTTPAQTLATSTTSVSATSPLDPNRTVFWRIVPVSRGVAMPDLASPVWSFRVQIPAGTTGDRPATSWGHAFDFDADGAADLAIAAPVRMGSITAKAGDVLVGSYNRSVRALVPFRRYMVPAFSVPSTYADSALRLFAAGDLDGDGDSELVVALPAHAGGMGRVQIYHGSRTPTIADPDGPVLSGSAASSYFGSVATGVGDVDGDGYGDLLVTAPERATAQLFHGSARGLGATPALMLMGPAGSRFGTSAAGIGDINGDGFADIAIARPGNPLVCDASVDVHLGSASGLQRTPAWTLRPMLDVEPCGYGAALAGVGDVDGDGAPDFAVGAPDALLGAGRVYVYLSAGAAMPREVLIDATARNTHQGALVAGADINADGYSDVLCATLPTPGTMSTVGVVPGLPGFATARAIRYISVPTATGADRWIGRCLAAAADLNNDNIRDVVLGIPVQGQAASLYGTTNIDNLGMGAEGFARFGASPPVSMMGMHCLTGY